MTNKLTLLAVLSVGTMACTATSAPPPSVTKVYDFSVRRLDAPRSPSPTASSSPRSLLRFAIAAMDARLAACASSSAHPAGTIDITTRVVIDRERSAIEGVDVNAFGDAGLAACFRDALLAVDVPSIEVPEPELWTLHTPVIVDANDTATR